MLKSQASLERGIIIAVTLVIAVMAVAVIFYFFSGIDLNSSFSISAMKITNFGNDTISFILFSNTKLPNPKNISIYVNSIQNGFNTSNMNYNISYSGGKYSYSYSGTISPSMESMLSSAVNPTLLISETSNGKTIFTTTDVLLKTTTYSPLINRITFYIFPSTTTDFRISLSNYTSLITNGETIYLSNGKFNLSAVQINPNSNYYFKSWYTSASFGLLNVSSNSSMSTILDVKNTSGTVLLYLVNYGAINFTSNENNLINSGNNYACGENSSRFCIDNSVRNLYYTYSENSSSFNFEYPPLLSGNSTERLGFMEYNTSYVEKNGEQSCSSGLNQFDSSQSVQNLGIAPCVVYAVYKPEYAINVLSANSSNGDVSVYTAYNGKTITGTNVTVWAPKGTSVQITANPKTYYQFSNWTEIPGNQISTINPYSFTVSSSAKYIAKFKVNLPTISWIANSNLGSVSASFSANAIPSNSLIGWSNITSGTTPYTFTFNKSNVFSSNTLNTTFTFNGAFTSAIPAQDGSQNSGSFTGITIYCGSSSVSTFSTESYSYNWESSNDCQNTTIEADYHLTPPPPPPPPSGPYYIYGCVLNSAGDCIQSLNGSSFTTAVGHYNTSLTSNDSQVESTYPFPSGGYSGNGAAFNVATKLVNNSDVLQLQGIVGVGYCDSGSLCSGSYTQWTSYYGGANRIAEYSCSGSSCPTGSGTSGGSGFFNANMTQFLFKEIDPVGVSMNLTTSNMNVANFSVYTINDGKTSSYENPLISNGDDNFSFEQVDAHKSFGNNFDPTYGTSNGEIFQNIPNYNTTQTEIIFPKNFSYNGNYTFNKQYILANYTFVLKNGTKISTSVPAPYHKTNNNIVVDFNTSFASFVFHNETSNAKGIDGGYVSSYTLNFTFGYIKEIKHSGEITIINYPDDISNLTIQIPSSIQHSAPISSFPADFVNSTEYLITTNKIETYSINVFAKIPQPNFKDEYILNVYDNTTGKIIDNYNNQNETSGEQSVSGLLTNQTYTIRAIYYVPVVINTNFVGKPLAFGNENLQSPFEVNNFIDNNYYLEKSLGLYIEGQQPYYDYGYQNETFFTLPAPISSIDNISNYPLPTIADGYWSNGNFNTNTSILDSGGLTKCAETGVVGNCITFEGVLPSTIYNPINGKVETKQVTGGPTLPSVTITANKTIFDGTYKVYQGNINESCPTLNGNSSIANCTESFGQGGIILESMDTRPYINPINYSYMFASIDDIATPTAINLNYGYYIPVYVGANANYSGWCVSSYYGATYSSLLNALQQSANDTLSAGPCLSPLAEGRPHPVLNLYMDNVNETNESITLIDSPITYLENKTIHCTVTTGNCQTPIEFVQYNLHNSPVGFKTSPLIDNEGSSKYKYISNYGVYRIYNTSYPSSWSVDNGYIFYEYDSGTG